MAEESLLHFHGTRYWLHVWTVMPNHVHALFEPIDGWTLGRIIGTWKKHTARRVRDYLARRSSAETSMGRNAVCPVWHREYWDRFIRNERHYAAAVAYIHENPAKAGLCTVARDWLWSSARLLWGGEGQLAGR